MINLSENAIKQDCPHCNPNSFALKHMLIETDNFWVCCDVHPLCEGHILIIPQTHLSCIGEYPDEILDEYLSLHEQVSKFIKDTYGTINTFEHGKIGQTVFHSHVHLLPCECNEDDIIPEGKKYLTKLDAIPELRKIFEKDGQYLFFSIEERLWTVDVKLGASRFFRNRFSKALGSPGRGPWKEMHENQEVMKKADEEIKGLEEKWKRFNQDK